MSDDPKEVLDFVDFSHATTAAGYDQEDRGWSKMAQLEAALAENEAALATAHEALNKALSGWARRAPGTLGWYCRCCSGEGVAIDGIRHHKDCPVLKLDAPALQRATELDRLRREVAAAVQRERDANARLAAVGSLDHDGDDIEFLDLFDRAQEEWIVARASTDNALAALRAEEEKG